MALGKLSILGALLINLTAVSHPATANENPLIALRESDQRVAAVGLRLFSGNAALCPALFPATGMVLHSLTQYRGTARDAAMSLWAFPAPVSVEAVVPGSPADQAGLRSGDGIVSLAGFVLPSVVPLGSRPTALRDSAEIYLQSLAPAGKIPMSIQRGDKTLSLVVTPQPACLTRLEVVAGMPLKARSDGSIIQLGQDFAAQLSDGELAFVIAHELAHTIGRHRAQLSALEASKSPVARHQRAALARQFEDEADLVALDLMANAGWNPALAPTFMRTKGTKFEPLIRIGGSHRSANERAARLEKALAQKDAKPL